VPDERKLEKTGTRGVFRRHANTCKRKGRCGCPYVVRWKAHGRSHKQMFPTLELAREFKAGLDSGAHRAPLSSKRVADYYEAWIERYAGRTTRGLEPETRAEYERSFRLHILPLPLARLRMREVRAPDVIDFYRQLESCGASPATVRKAKRALSVMFASAVEYGELGSNPVRDARYVPSDQAKRGHPPRKRRKLTAADVAAILDAMDEEWRLFFLLLAQTGLRISEALGLTWRNVHLGDDPHIRVEEQLYRGRRKKLKTDSSVAALPLSAGLAQMLATIRPEGTPPSTPVFIGERGAPQHYSNLYNRILRPALRKSGIAVMVGEDERGRPRWDYQGVAFHSFRRACGSLLLAHGKTLKQVQGWLRHSQLTTTMNVYIHDVDAGLGGADAWDDILPAATVRPSSVRKGSPMPRRRRRRAQRRSAKRTVGTDQ
jgi:integrase